MAIGGEPGARARPQRAGGAIRLRVPGRIAVVVSTEL